MKASARCPHRVIWYRVCPWCKSDADEAYFKISRDDALFPMNAHCFTFWRGVPPCTEVEHRKIALVRRLMDNAIWQ